MRVAEVFFSIQGEGKLSGVPSVFVRASGCNLRCAWCDTPYASWEPEGASMDVAQIIDQVAAFPARHVVVTGGEPMIMPDITDLCGALRERQYHVTVETAATVFRPVAVDLASLSPKLANSTPQDHDGGRYAANHEKIRLQPHVIQQFIDQSADFQIKFVVTGEVDLGEIDRILSAVHGWSPEDVLLMPEGVAAATLDSRAQWIVEVCKERGFRFCPRLHIALYGQRRGT